MTRSQYYQQIRQLALAKRAEHGIETSKLNLTVVRRIYKKEGIRIDNWELKGRKIKAAYFCDEIDCSVLVNKNLPKIPKLFALVHELKHHYCDRESIQERKIQCGDYNANELIEKTAEVFAAEFIYPETEMRELASAIGIQRNTCTLEKIIEFKRSCPANISYQFIVKRFDWFGFIDVSSCKKIQFQKLEDKIYGKPFYQQEWYKAQRAAKKQII
jgi:Zn-dependent peptidase ImmA (M78 family)